jgi:hypothetical protein
MPACFIDLVNAYRSMSYSLGCSFIL